MPFNKIIVDPRLYGFAAIGGAGFMIAALIIIAFGRKELLNKGKLFPKDGSISNDDDIKEIESNIDSPINADNLEKTNTEQIKIISTS